MKIARALPLLGLMFFAGTAWADVQLGRQLFFNNGNPTTAGIVAAKAEFESVVQASPGNQEANFFLAVARIPALLDNGAAYTPGLPVENVRELLDSFGVNSAGREILNWTADFTRDVAGDIVLPFGAPSGPDIQGFFGAVIIPEINAALSNLSAVSSSFGILLLPTETGLDETIEIDYGDVLLYRTLLYSAKAILLCFSSYDIDADPLRLIQVLGNKLSNLNSELADLYVEFLNLLPGGPSKMEEAKQAALASIDEYNASSAFIRGETDFQGNDLVTIDLEEATKEAHFRDLLAEAKASLLAQRYATFEDSAKTQAHHIDLNRLFGTATISPVSPRALLPYFDSDGNIPAGTFPDSTLGGILIDCVTEAKLAEVSPLDLPIVFPIAQGTISMDGSEADWQSITAMNPGYFSSGSWGWDIRYVKVAKDSSYFYWMIRFQSSIQPGRYYSFYLYRSSSQGPYNLSATIQQTGEYDIWAYPSQQNYTGASADYRIGSNVVEGRIPLWLVDLGGTLGLGVYVANWNTGYNTSVSDSSIITGATPPIVTAGPDQVVSDSVSLDARLVFPDKIITSWQWSLRHRTYSSYNRSASGPNPTVSGLEAGIYDVILAVTDDTGKMYSDSMLLVATGETSGLYTQAEMDQAVQGEREKWDANGDGRIGLDEAIRALQVTSGVRQE